MFFPINFLVPEAHPPQIKDPKEVEQKYSYWRIQLVLFMFLGYSCFYMTRKSFTFVMPFISEDLGLTKTSLGIIATVLYISYGISKLLSGVLADKSNPRYFMAFGLITTGILNILFGFGSSLWIFVLIWGVNGVFQAWGWPAITKILTYWFEKRKRGFWWSICNTAHNIGGGVLPLFAVFLAVTFNWRVALWVPGTISIIMGFILIHRLRDIPQSLGLPAVTDDGKNDTSQESHLSIKEILFQQVLSNPTVWLLAFCYFAVYLLRMALGDWGMFFFIEEKHYSPALAGSAIFWFEVGGFFGVLTGGLVSDKIFKGNRLPYCFFCFLSIICVVNAIWYNPINVPGIDFIYMAILGFFVFGPQMLVGLAASENVDKQAAATANGFVGLFAYIGAACAGMPLGAILDQWNWQGFYYSLLFSTIIGGSLVAIVLLKQQINRRQERLSIVPAVS